MASSSRKMASGDLTYGTVARKCVVSGDGVHTAMSRQVQSFTIEARDAEGNKQQMGGDQFLVSVRGSSRVTAKVTDNEDGTYTVEYKPSTSGNYNISVTLNGVPLPDSPFPLLVLTPAPDAPRCVLRGDALKHARARELATFEVEFLDAMGQPARAEELDVWVARAPEEDETAKAKAEAPSPAPAPAAAAPTAKAAAAEAAAAAAAAPAPAVGKQPSGTQDPAGAAATAAAATAAASAPAADVPVEGAGDATAATGTGDSSPPAPDVLDAIAEEKRKKALRSYRQLRAEALARGGGNVEVGEKPLIMRVDAQLDSQLVSVLRPGQLVRVLEERLLDDEKIRARVALVEQGVAASAIADSWWSPVDPTKSLEESALLGGGAAVTDRISMRSPASMDPNDSISLSTALIAVGVLPPRTQRHGKPERQGWVTLVKNGAELVAERPRLNAGERQKHMELWKSREASDRAHKAMLNNPGAKKDGAHVGHTLANELKKDPMGMGFAFGGIHPGTLHAGGKNVKVHSVRYTIGAAGRYKLHVGLRNQAVSLPGSPFNLVVAPSNAHAPSTKLPEECLPLKGVVGDDWSCTCTLHVSDKMGNGCIAGGAPIVVDVESDAVTSRCVDNSDGSYTLEWRGKISGSYKTQVRIDGAHVLGSPTYIKMLAGPPDVPKCEISGGGLKTALAGQAARVYITCKDRFSNPLSADSLQGNALSFGLSLLPPGADGKAQSATVASMPFAGQWVKAQDHEGESFEIGYTAEEAGDFELYVWCDPDGASGGNRQWLTGSPFPVRVTGVRPSTSGSYVGGVDVLMGEPVTAGDMLSLRPQLRDQFGNASSAAEGEFEVLMETPVGVHSLELKSLKGLGAYEVSYEVQLKGAHSVQFLLQGHHIAGSPVEFTVLPAAALGTKSKLYPPVEPPQTHQPCEILLEAIDKFGNKLDRGGQRVEARANGPGVSGCTSEDKGDGTYTISFTAAVVGETRVIVRLDNVEMQPLKLVFVAPSEAGGVNADGVKRAKSKNMNAFLGEDGAPIDIQ